MTISYELAPIPKWYIADLTGLPLGGGSMYTYRSLNKTQQKLIYQDPSGTNPWTNPVLFDENGAQGPFYWTVDSASLDETYYIEVFDADGVLQWTIDHFLPPQGGGGSIITTALNLENLVANNVMWRNIGTSISPLPTFLTVAPGAHAGFATTASNAGGDINFVKNNTSANDAITFPLFPLGTNVFTGDVTPIDYCNYVCTNAPLGETLKVFQFPITSGVGNLSNQDVTVTIWAKGDQDIGLYWWQFYGDGASATPSAPLLFQTLSLTGSWQKFTVLDTVPNASGNVIGECGNSALFLQIGMPLGVACDISFQKPSLYLGSISPEEDYHTYDMIDGELNVPRTGDVRVGFSAQTYAYPGFIIMNDTSIGSATSGATRANIDTFPLYNLLWNNVSDTYAPVSTGRGATAIDDFQNNKTLTMPRTLGRALAEAGSGAGLTARVLGEYLGSETLTVGELPAHTHPAPAGSGGQFISTGTGGSNIGTGATSSHVGTTTGSTGSGTAGSKMQPTIFMNYFIKL